jgi:Na+/melibiose symporter-like transporter
MLQALNLSQYSSETLLFIFLAVGIGGFAVGYVTDVVMGDRGFGPFGNGFLAVFGAIIGIYIRNTFFGKMDPGDLFVTGIFAGAMATLMLLLVGVAKRFVQN